MKTSRFIEVVEDLVANAIMGLNIMENYRIYIESDERKFKHIPSTSMII
jgi:hypothetical protein